MKIDELIIKANNGVPEAQNSLGEIYMVGNGIPEDPQEGAFWFLQAANAKYPIAMSNYGMCLLLGHGVDKDTEQGLDYIKEAYMYGDNEAVHKVLSAIDVKALDINDLIQLVDTNTNAMFVLSLCLRNGVGYELSEENYLYGHNLLVKACEHKNPAALFFAANGMRMLASSNHDLLMSKRYYSKATFRRNEHGYANQTLRFSLKHIYQQLESDTQALLMKVIPVCDREHLPEDQFLQDMLDGKLFMKKIEQFNSSISDDATSQNDYRGDTTEGACISPFARNFDEPQNNSTKYYIDKAAIAQKVYCITALDYSTKEHAFYPISPEMQQFGKYAVIIRDPGEFLNRIRTSFERYCTIDNANYKLRYGRVIYDFGGVEMVYFDVFHKDPNYAWQNEFRITLDFSDGKSHQTPWNNMTDVSKLTTENPAILDTNPLFTADWIYFEIGNIRDICTVMTIDELLSGSISNIGTIKPIPLPSFSSK